MSETKISVLQLAHVFLMKDGVMVCRLVELNLTNENLLPHN